MKLSTLIVSRRVLLFISLAIVVLVLPSSIIPFWYKMTKNMERSVDLNIHQFHSGLLAEVENSAKTLKPLNSSTASLARYLTSSLNQIELSSTSYIANKMAPLLFEAFSTIPHLSQISYIGLGGPSFSYFYEGNQTYAMFSNLSEISNQSSYSWYQQLVDPIQGKLYGDAIESSPPSININISSWKSLNSNKGYAFLGSGWNSGHEPLLITTVGIHGQGVISLGFSLKQLMSFFNGVELYGGSLYLATPQGEILVRSRLPNTTLMAVNKESVSFGLLKPSGDGEEVALVADVPCIPSDHGSLRTASRLEIGESKFLAYCSPLDIVGVHSVHVLVLPLDDTMSRIHHSSKIGMILLMVMIGAVIIFISSSVLLMMGATCREMRLCSSLIKQMEATQQAERKSMNKSLAFASASHDIRTALAGITGLIEVCYGEVTPGTELDTNLHQMDGCAKDLVGLLNSILDTSKIESGKMQLEEEEFNLSHLLEDVVDLYHPLAMDKGVDVVWDHCDGSILKYSHLRGDRVKLKQVLCNLLSNAVKFTSEGEISVRAWAQKPRAQNKIIISSNRNILWKRFSSLFYKKRDHIETMTSVVQNPNTMEFIFEVDDTGAGIPKDKQKSVFENFVQVKETALGQGGTGLGLGIVQSLVRLMGGEIGIVDKESGQRGTCFRFNIFLTTTETPSTDHNNETAGGDAHVGLTVRTPSHNLAIRNTSPRLPILTPSPKNTEGSTVLLLIKNVERRRSTQKFMENLGIKVVTISRWESLSCTLMKMKFKQNPSSHSSSGSSENFSARSKETALSAMDGIDHKLPSPYRGGSGSTTMRGGALGFVLLVIDACAGPFKELYKVVGEFKAGLSNPNCCKVIWLDRPTSRCIDVRNLEDPSDHVILKPFHGSRLFQVIRLLPEFRGTGTPSSHQGMSTKSRKDKSPQPIITSSSSSADQYSHLLRLNCRRSPERKMEIQEEGTRKRSYSPPSHDAPPKPKVSEIEEEDSKFSSDKPLSGIRLLVAEDGATLRMLAMKKLEKLGAKVELCENGKEALQLVRTRLQKQAAAAERGNYFVPPYDYILMDCEMPEMNGYEATREIRKLEAKYGIHNPIIALTANTSGGDAEKTAEAGMDAHLGKPLKEDHLLQIIRKFHNKTPPKS